MIGNMVKQSKIMGRYRTIKLKEFYMGKGKNVNGDGLKDIWEKIDLRNQDWKPGDEKEKAFNQNIEWLFPLGYYRSRFVFSPGLSNRQVKILKHEMLVRARMITSLKYVLKNYGLVLTFSNDDTLIIYPESENREDYSLIWLQERKLHYERLYRIIKSLRLFGLDQFADALKQAMKDRIDNQYSISNQTIFL